VQKVTLKQLAITLDEVVLSKRFETREIEIGKVKNETFQAFDNAPRIDAKFSPIMLNIRRQGILSKLQYTRIVK